MLHRYLLFIFFIALACTEEVRFDPNGDRYLPLQVGNYWRFEAPNALGFDAEYTIIDEVEIYGKSYFQFHIKSATGTVDEYEGLSYYRIDSRDVVHFLRDSVNSIETVYLNLGAPDGYQYKSSDYTATVRTESFDLNGHVLDECKSFYYDIPTTYDDEHSVTLAAGIGYIFIHASFGRTAQLVEARINGVEHTFGE